MKKALFFRYRPDFAAARTGIAQQSESAVCILYHIAGCKGRCLLNSSSLPSNWH